MVIPFSEKHEVDFGCLGFSEEQADLLDSAGNFCSERSPVDKVRLQMESAENFDGDLWKEIAELGWLGILIPEHQGGSGLSIAEAVPVVEQMGRRLMSTPYVPTMLAVAALMEASEPHDGRGTLKTLVEGGVGTIAFMEKTGSWDVKNISVKVHDDGDEIVFSGVKNFVEYGPDADVVIVSAIYHQNPVLIVLERSCIPQGVFRRETVIDETRRVFELTLDGVRCPGSAVMADKRAVNILKKVQMMATLLSSAECCGAAQGVIEYTLDYLKTRKQFGRTIGSYQSLKHTMVDAYIEYEQARSHLYSAAHCFGEQGTGEIATHMARVKADQVLSFAADRSIQFHGGFGFTWDCDAQLYRRRALYHAALYGDAAWHKRQLATLLF